MKRLLTLAVLFLCCMATSFAQFSGSGSGTESDPYLIMNPIQLNQLRNFLKQSGVYFKLMADIDLTEFLEEENPSEGWQPVGTSSTPFKGILDGNGKTISGFWIKRSGTDYVGFFGNLNGGTVKNLTLTGGNVHGNEHVGFLSGYGGTVSDCSFSGSVSGYSYIGGCIGKSGVINRVKSTVDVLGKWHSYTIKDGEKIYDGGDYVGGLSGSNGSFNDCIVTNNYVSGINYVGGICGSNGNENVTNSCYVYSNVSGNNFIGGIYGKSDSYNCDILNSGFCGNIEVWV